MNNFKKRFNELIDHLKDDLGKDLVSSSINSNYVKIFVKLESIQKVLLYLRDHPEYRFSQLVNLCGVDYLTSKKKRFEVVYHLLSLKWNGRLVVKVCVDEDDLVPTATSIYSSAGWYERETWDLFGIHFQGHPDLRRILTDYGFEGHPLRKDFPLSGYVEPRYDESIKEIVYAPVKLPQAYRSFDFLSPWENLENSVLPGDEK
jgi:NADH-quinone oxidoreductase subunit C